MNQLSLGITLRDSGISRVTSNAEHFVKLMREVAIDLSQRNGSVTSDDLREYAERHGLKPHHPNAWGGIFRGKEWSVVGRVQSRIAGNHAREVKVWRLAK